MSKSFEKVLPNGVTSELLKASGFEKRKERIGKTTYHYYNISTDSLATLYTYCVGGVQTPPTNNNQPSSPPTISTCNIVGHNRIPTAVESTLASNLESEVNQISSNVVTSSSPQGEGPIARASSEAMGQVLTTTTSQVQQEPIQINKNAPESNPMTKNSQSSIQEPTSPNEAYTASQSQQEESIKEIAATLTKEQIEEIFKDPKSRLDFFQLIDEETFDRLTPIQKSNCPPLYRKKFSWFNRKK
jgi:CHAT domain-containing protein